MLSESDFDALALGFFLPQEDPVNSKYSLSLKANTAWEDLYAINLHCREGDFSKLTHVREILLRSQDSLIWYAGVNILGCAGGWTEVTDALSHLQKLQNEEWVRFHLSALIGLSCDIRAVPLLVKLYSIGTNPHEDRDQTLRELSYLLESDDGAIFYSRHDQPTSEALAEQVDSIRSSVADGLIGMKVFEGRALDVVQLAKGMLAKLETEDAQSERFHRGLLIFEAATGVNCTGLFNEKGRDRRLDAVAVLEDFLDGDNTSRFVPGTRYFFGHPIRD
ncbi:MAG: hypothetical protein EOS28_03410 [Mesorhizobium sp.]|nr:MAG: hypothetical protein EOS28_03410 [Mesorhizobium sp.]